jgi:hypothetical protein
MNPADQIRVRASDRIKLVKVDSTKPAQKDAEAAAGACCGDKSMTLTLGHFLTLGAMLFALSVVGIFLNRKNLIVC